MASEKPRCATCKHALFSPDSESGVCELSAPQVTVIPGRKVEGGAFDDRILATQPPITPLTGCANHPGFAAWFREETTGLGRYADTADPRQPYTCQCVIMGDISKNRIYRGYRVIDHNARKLSILKSCKMCSGSGIPRPEPEIPSDFRDEPLDEEEDSQLGVVIGEND